MLSLPGFMLHTYDRVTTFLENVEMLVNLTAVGEKILSETGLLLISCLGLHQCLLGSFGSVKQFLNVLTDEKCA